MSDHAINRWLARAEKEIAQAHREIARERAFEASLHAERAHAILTTLNEVRTVNVLLSMLPKRARFVDRACLHSQMSSLIDRLALLA